MTRLALYQPDIAPNVGTIIRTAACLGTAVDVIEPCGFPFGDRSLRRAGMDYVELAAVTRHTSWEAYQRVPRAGRLILLSTKAAVPYTTFEFQPEDTLLLGRESAGVPQEVVDLVDAAVLIPMAEGRRSLNVAIAAGMVLGEALRQTGGFPPAPAEA